MQLKQIWGFGLTLLGLAALLYAKPVLAGASDLPSGITATPISTNVGSVVDICVLDASSAFIIDKGGVVYFYQAGSIVNALDLASSSSLPLFNSGESGLLSCLAKGTSLFTFYTTTQGKAVLTKWTFDAGTGIVDSATEVIILELPSTPYSNHVGGALEWEGDYIVVSRGDGAGCDHNEADRCALVQNVTSQLGKLLRIDQSGNAIADNDWWTGNASEVASQVWAPGFRNPWTMTRDPVNDDLIVFDVGTSTRESIKRIRKGVQGNWPCLEGTYNRSRCTNMLLPTDLSVVIYEYDHNHGSCIIGGVFVPTERYRPDFAGKILFADFGGALWLADRAFSNITDFGNDPYPARLKIGPNKRIWLLNQGGGIQELVDDLEPMTVTRTTTTTSTSKTRTTSSQTRTTSTRSRTTTPTRTRTATRTITTTCATPNFKGTVPALERPLWPLSWLPNSGLTIRCRLASGLPCGRNGRLVGNNRGVVLPMKINGVRYSKGFGVRGSSNVTVDLFGKCGSLSIGAGIDDSSTSTAARVIFQIIADGKQIFGSGARGKGQAARWASVNLVGVQQLILRTRQTVPGDHNADWVEPLLACGPESPYLPNVQMIPIGNWNGKSAGPGARVGFRAWGADYRGFGLDSLAFNWQLDVYKCARGACTGEAAVVRALNARNFTLSLPVAGAGCIFYQVIVEGKDACGRKNRAFSSIWVPGRENLCSSVGRRFGL